MGRPGCHDLKLAKYHHSRVSIFFEAVLGLRSPSEAQRRVVEIAAPLPLLQRRMQTHKFRRKADRNWRCRLAWSWIQRGIRRVYMIAPVPCKVDSQSNALYTMSGSKAKVQRNLACKPWYIRTEWRISCCFGMKTCKAVERRLNPASLDRRHHI